MAKEGQDKGENERQKPSGALRRLIDGLREKKGSQGKTAADRARQRILDEGPTGPGGHKTVKKILAKGPKEPKKALKPDDIPPLQDAPEGKEPPPLTDEVPADSAISDDKKPEKARNLTWDEFEEIVMELIKQARTRQSKCLDDMAEHARLTGFIGRVETFYEAYTKDIKKAKTRLEEEQAITREALERLAELEKEWEEAFKTRPPEKDSDGRFDL